jgi:MATE family multidrug resistance protein
MKLGLGLCLVRGVGPLPPQGVLGASISTILAYGTATGLFVMHLARHGLFVGVGAACSPSRLPAFWKSDILRQGAPVSLQQLTEVGALYITGIMAGWLGTDAAAAHGVAVNVINGVGLVSLALAQGASLDVGNAAREGGVVAASLRSAALALGVAASIAALVVLARGTLFAATPGVSALALLVAAALLADGVQMSLGGALRGLVDAKFVALATFGCWFLFCVPLSYALAFALRLGIYGLWASIAATSLLAAVVLGARLQHLARPRSLRGVTAGTAS